VFNKEELNVFKSAGLLQVQCEDCVDQEEPPKRRFRSSFALVVLFGVLLGAISIQWQGQHG